MKDTLMIAKKMFCSYQGYNDEDKQITYGNFVVNSDEISGEVSLSSFVLSKAKEYNKNVVAVNIVCLSPIEFEIITKD